MTATIYSVATAAGVSTATVSRALRDREKVSPATYESVMRAVDSLGYVPRGSASSLARKSAGTLGLVLPHITGWYYAELVIGFELAASELNLAAIVTLANSRADAKQTVRELAERTDGIAFLARSAVTDDIISSIRRARPVLTGARGEVSGVESVRVENREPARDLAGRLLDSGRRRIVFVGTPEPGSDVAERWIGCQEAHDQRGMEPCQILPAALEESAGAEAVAHLLASGTPHDAVLCANDNIALAAVQALQRAGRVVPDDVAVTGWDDVQAARFITPSLTTVSQPVVDLGASAARRLQRLVGGARPAAEPLVHAATLVLRDSCGTHQNTTN